MNGQAHVQPRGVTAGAWLRVGNGLPCILEAQACHDRKAAVGGNVPEADTEAPPSALSWVLETR